MNFIRKYRFDIILLLLSLAFPLFVWLSTEPVAVRFADSWATFTSLGQLTGLAGTVLVAVSMIFQVRLCRYFKFLSKPTTIQNIHHYSGLYGLFLLLLHPLLLAIRYLSISIPAAAEFLYTNDPVNLFGLIALVIMLVSVYFSLFVARNFKFWKLIHQLMLVAYLGIVYHLIFVESDISSSFVLRTYTLGMIIAGGLAFAVQKVDYYVKKNKGVSNEDSC